jgi:hypothetical protein
MPNAASGTLSLADIRYALVLDPEADLAAEVRMQIRLSYAVGEFEAGSERSYDTAVAKQKVYAAKLELLIRSDPVSYHLKDKPNEGEIKAAIIADDKYKEMERAILDARYEHKIMKALVSGIHDRRRAIEMMIDLMWFEYNAVPRPRTPGGTETQQAVGAVSARGPVAGPKRKTKSEG